MRKNSSNQPSPRPPTYASFFDDDKDPNPSFWSKKHQFKDSKDWTPIIGHYFFKNSKKKPGEQKRVYICLFKNHLVISKFKEWYRKYKTLDLSKYFITLRKISKPTGSSPFGFSLAYNNKFIEVFTKESNEVNAFIYQLKKYVIQTNFNEIYTPKEKLGAGSYAEVFRLEDNLTHTVYAGKMFNLTALKMKEKRLSTDAMKNEIMIQRQLDHEHIAKLYEVYETETKVILVIEFIQGRRLLDYVIELAPLSEKKSILIMKQLLEATIYLHSLDFVHRDIKLENIMVTGEKDKVSGKSEKLTLKLLDFGLAVNVDNIEFLKKSGTPGYVAPEIMLADTYGQNVDIFSLGVILFTALSGRSPFIGPDRKTVLTLNKRCEYSFKSRHWAKKSVNSKDLVRKMMDPDPNRRIDARTALEHPWFTLVYLNGTQPLINIPRSMDVSNKHIFASGKLEIRPFPRDPSTMTPRSRKRSAPPTPIDIIRITNSEKRKSTMETNRSGSVRSFDLKARNKHLGIPHLLQIPSHLKGQSASQEQGGKSIGLDDGRLDTTSLEDGINKSSIKTFYKVSSSSNYESFTHSEPTPSARRKQQQLNRSTTLDDEIARENPDVKDKINSFRGVDAASYRYSSYIDSRSHGMPSLSGIPESREDRQSCEMSLASIAEVKAQYPKKQSKFKAFSPRLKSVTSKIIN